MFSGLRSRCSTPRACVAASASAAEAKKPAASAASIVPRRAAGAACGRDIFRDDVGRAVFAEARQQVRDTLDAVQQRQDLGLVQETLQLGALRRARRERPRLAETSASRQSSPAGKNSLTAALPPPSESAARYVMENPPRPSTERTRQRPSSTVPAGSSMPPIGRLLSINHSVEVQRAEGILPGYPGVLLHVSSGSSSASHSAASRDAASSEMGTLNTVKPAPAVPSPAFGRGR